MTPKEKATELALKFGDVEIYINHDPKDINCNIYDTTSRWLTIKQCALISVNEILNNTGCGCCNQSEKKLLEPS